MERIGRWRSWMVGGALGVLLVLLLSSATGWIVRGHLRLAGPPFSAPDVLGQLGVHQAPLYGDIGVRNPAPSKGRDWRVVRRHPDDYGVNLAYAYQHAAPATPDEATAMGAITMYEGRIAPLIARFPNNPAVYADVLRMACMRYPIGGRDEEWLISQDSVPEDAHRHPRSPLTGRQSAFLEETAATGERLDPDNAYFPMMRAVVLLEANRDQEAVEAILRAGTKHDFRDYAGQEAEGSWRIHQEATGDRGSLAHLAYASATLLPHYAALRGVARVATYKAIVAEREGRKEEGLAIRAAQMRVCSLMRAKSSSLIGTLVGIGMAQIATVRPGGIPPDPKATSVETDAERAAKIDARVARYLAYVRGIGHPDEADWASHELKACTEARAISRRAFRVDDWLLSVQRTGALGVASASVFMSAMWLLVAAAVAAVAARGRRIRAGLPMTAAARIGAAVGVTVAIGCAMALALLPMSDTVAATVAALPPIGLLVLARARHGEGSWAGLAAAASATITMAVAGALVFLALRPGLSVTIGLGQVISQLLSGGEMVAPHLPWAATVAALCPVLIAPVAVLCMVIVSWRCRVPVSVGLVRGFRGLGVPLACLLVLPYGAAVAFQARAETSANTGIERRWKGEGKLMAEMIGVEWPGVTR